MARYELSVIEAVVNWLETIDKSARRRALLYVNDYIMSQCDRGEDTAPPDEAAAPRNGDKCEAGHGEQQGDTSDAAYSSPSIADVAERARRDLRPRPLWWEKPSKQFDMGTL